MVFGRRLVAIFFEQSSEPIVGFLVEVGIVELIDRFDRFFELSLGQLAFLFGDEAFPQRRECSGFEPIVLDADLEQGDGLDVVLDPHVAGPEFELQFQVVGVPFDSSRKHLNLALDQFPTDRSGVLLSLLIVGLSCGVFLGEVEVGSELIEFDVFECFADGCVAA